MSSDRRPAKTHPSTRSRQNKDFKNVFFLVTCEHGGNRIPARFRSCLAGHEAVLQTHRAYDAGALPLARKLARALHAPLIVSTVSRLLIELNRSLGHTHLYSEFTQHAAPKLRDALLKEYYLPYRDQVRTQVAQATQRGKRVLHLSSHSFTPIFNSEVRDADIGLLYDPARHGERELCRSWKRCLRIQTPQFKSRLNYPYRGTDDGLTQHLRRHFGNEDYFGIELEINQRYFLQDKKCWRMLSSAVIDGLFCAIEASFQEKR
jgi:predicted N-formylglutamate amidohydrolase